MRKKSLSSGLITGLATLISGALSGYFLLPQKPSLSGSESGVSWGFFYGPGIFFGVVTLAVCLWLYRRRWKWAVPRGLLWVGVSIGAWRLAIIIALSGGSNGWLTYLLAGLAGSAILAAGFWILVHRPSLGRLLLVPATGAALGWVMSFIVGNETLGGSFSLMLAFALWQVGVALVLIEPPREL